MSQAAEAGKRLVVRVAIIAVALALLPTPITFDVTLVGVRLSTYHVRIVFTLLLCFFLIRGHTWARVVGIVSFGIFGAASLAGSMLVPGKSPSDLELVAAGVAHLYCAGLLIASAPVLEFFDARRRPPREDHTGSPDPRKPG